MEMKYRVLRFIKDDPESAMLIGHFDTKMQARTAASDDLYNHNEKYELQYNIESVSQILTQEEITKIFRERKALYEKGEL